MRVETSRAVRTRRTGLGFGAALGTGGLVFLVVTIVAGVIFALSPGGASSVAATFLKAQPGSISWDTHSRLTVLFIGTDSRSASVNSMTIVSFDPSSRNLRMLSIPNHLWVTVPGSGQAAVGDSYAIGGPSLALETVESVTHVVIPYFAVMSTDAIRRWIDAFGGVRVRVDVPLGRDPAGTYRLTPGTRHLTGEQSLTFALASSPYDTDGSDRLQRQQSLLTALMHQDLAPQDLIKLPQVVNSLGGSIRTNFPYDQIPDLAHALTSVSKSGTSGRSIGTGNATASTYRSGGNTVLLPDHQRISALAHRLFPEESLRDYGPVAVLNGAGVQGQAAALAAWIGQARIHVGTVTSAPSYNFAHTQVRVASDAPKSTMVLANGIADLLQIPIVRRPIRGLQEKVAVVIGQDFQDPTQQ